MSTSTSPPPKRLYDQELAIVPGQPDVLHHSVVELGEMGAVAGAPAPFAHGRDDMVFRIGQRENRVVLPGLASGCMPMNCRHMKSPKLGERRECALVELT